MKAHKRSRTIAPLTLSPRGEKNHGTHWIGGKVSPRAALDVSVSSGHRGFSSTSNIDLSSSALERTRLLGMDIFWVAKGMCGRMETLFHLIYFRVNSPLYRFDGVMGVSASLDPVGKKMLLILPESEPRFSCHPVRSLVIIPTELLWLPANSGVVAV
jgi:hypothetical protein